MGRLRYICFGVLAALLFAFCYEKRQNIVSNTTDLRLTHYDAAKHQPRKVCWKKGAKKHFFKKHKRTRIWVQFSKFVLPGSPVTEPVKDITEIATTAVYVYPYYHSSDIHFGLRGPPVIA